MLEALRAQYEPELKCRCGAENSPSLRSIHIETMQHVACDNCGQTGPLDKFLRKEPRT